MTCVMILT